LAEALPQRVVVGLIGTLGAGKTRLVQAVAKACEVREDVSSPTFVMIREYQGRRPIFHFDAYRVRDDDEFQELGPTEYFESDGLTFIEWSDRVHRHLPDDRVEIEIIALSETAREFHIRVIGDQLAPLILRLQETLG